jgi:hypothetical protein
MESYVVESFEKWLTDEHATPLWRQTGSLKIYKKNEELNWLFLGNKEQWEEAFTSLNSIKERVLDETKHMEIERIRFFGDSSPKDDWILCGNHSLVYGSIRMLVTVDFISDSFIGHIFLPVKVKSNWYLNDVHNECLKWSSYNHSFSIVDFSNYETNLGISDKLSDFAHKMRSLDSELILKGTAYHESLLIPLM